MEKIKMTKIMKNEPCPCGSGRKYKGCCQIRKDETLPMERLMTNEKFLNHYVLQALRDSNIEECLHPNTDECRGKIKRAHSLQNHGILSKLAEKNHVIVIKPGVDLSGISVELGEEGRNKASTFTGFCDYHDSVVFREIETLTYDRSPKQIFLYAYRALALEFHKKKVAYAAFQGIIRKRPSLLGDPDFVMTYRSHQLAVKDLHNYKHHFDDGLLNANSDLITTLLIELDIEVEFAVCSGFALDVDIEGNLLNDLISLDEEPLKNIFITIFPGDGKSFVLVSWLTKDQEFFCKYENQLKNLTLPELKKYLNYLIPAYTENIVLSPRLWESFTGFMRRQFIEMLSPEFLYNESQSDFDNREKTCSKMTYDLFRNV